MDVCDNDVTQRLNIDDETFFETKTSTSKAELQNLKSKIISKLYQA